MTLSQYQVCGNLRKVTFITIQSTLKLYTLDVSKPPGNHRRQVESNLPLTCLDLTTTRALEARKSFLSPHFISQ